MQTGPNEDVMVRLFEKYTWQEIHNEIGCQQDLLHIWQNPDVSWDRLGLRRVLKPTNC